MYTLTNCSLFGAKYNLPAIPSIEKDHHWFAQVWDAVCSIGQWEYIHGMSMATKGKFNIYFDLCHLSVLKRIPYIQMW